MASRLIDKLVMNDVLVDQYITKPIALARVINADNVAEYVANNEIANMETYYEPVFDTFEPSRHRLLDRIPRIMLPFDLTFIQFRWQGDEYGFLSQNKGMLKYTYNDTVDEQTRLYRASQIDDPNDVTFILNADGTLCRKNNWVFLGTDYGAFWEIPPEQFFPIVIAFWTLAFMNCKNAVLEEIEPRENKRRAKHGKSPLMRYHVLKLKPFGGRSDNEGQGGTHAAPALHIRRGHFKTYTDDAPRLGRDVGTFWYQQTIAGRKSNHVVVKDYEMDLTGAK